jgi:hypothetical protein
MRILAVFLMASLACAQQTKSRIAEGFDSIQVARLKERANEMVGLKLNYKWDRDAANNVLFRSDQYPFLQHDIPAVWWFTGFHPDYHLVTDTVEKINFGKMANILKLAYASGFEFADSRDIPKLVGKAMSRQ